MRLRASRESAADDFENVLVVTNALSKNPASFEKHTCFANARPCFNDFGRLGFVVGFAAIIG